MHVRFPGAAQLELMFRSEAEYVVDAIAGQKKGPYVSFFHAVVSADLGELPSDDIEAFATRMLEANHLFACTGGAALAVEGDRALLERRIRFAELSRGEGAHVVYPFIGTARSLRHTLREELLF